MSLRSDLMWYIWGNYPGDIVELEDRLYEAGINIGYIQKYISDFITELIKDAEKGNIHVSDTD